MSVENETHMRKWLLPANSFSCKWKALPLLGLEAYDKKKKIVQKLKKLFLRIITSGYTEIFRNITGLLRGHMGEKTEEVFFGTLNFRFRF